MRSKGAELGVRTEAIPDLQSSLALWYLKLDSELVFVGDAGTTEAGRPSQRYGVEWNNRWRPLPWLFLDLDVAWNHARFTGQAEEGDFIPGAPDSVISAGAAIDHYGPWSGALFVRYIGAYPLVEDNSVRAHVVDRRRCADRVRDRSQYPAASRRLQPLRRARPTISRTSMRRDCPASRPEA